MFNSRSPLFFLIALSLFIGLISAAPVAPKGHAAPRTKGHAAPRTKGHAVPRTKGHAAPRAKGHAVLPTKGHAAPSCPANLRPRSGGKILLGYNGFNGTPRKPQASAGGELGAVFYVADAVDLAKSFARGADASKDYVCMVFADADAWATQPKVWVPANAPLGNAMNAHYPGSVLFAEHAKVGLPTASPEKVYQMGIRQDQITRLGVTVECYPKSCFAAEHQSLAYDKMKKDWEIQEIK